MKILSRLPAGLRQTVCLTMIIKNEKDSDESHCILRCLESCKKLIDSVCIVFTHQPHQLPGGTNRIVGAWCSENGINFLSDWHAWTGDFAEARNKALRVANDHASDSWLLLLDADEELCIDLPEAQKALRDEAAPSYTIPMVIGGQLFTRINLIRNIPGWAYRHKHHETIEWQGGRPTSILLGNLDEPTRGSHVITKGDGARSLDPEKNTKDLAVLRGAWEETKDPRYLFYAGMTYMNTGRRDEARDTLLEFSRAARLSNTDRVMIYHGVLSLARLAVMEAKPENMGDQLNLAKDMLFYAMSLCPDRAEALCELATVYGHSKQWAQSRIYALAALINPTPKELAYIEPHWLQWRALDILSVALINLGWHNQALDVLEVLRTKSGVPAGDQKRILEHLDAMKYEVKRG